MKKRIFVALGLIIFISVFVLQGSAFFKKDFVLTIYDDENIILQKTYKIEPKAMLKTRFLYKGNYEKLYNILIEKEEFPLEKINKELSLDVENLPRIYNKTPKDAQVKYHGDGKFTYKKEETGHKVNTNIIVKSIFSSLNSDGVVQLSKDNLEPKINEYHLKQTTKKIAEFSTSCQGSSAERKHNIDLALSKINGSQILPNAEFSFNKVVGPRTAERGFKTAKIIVSGEFVAGVGGGVCQVSSTLYNAWCLAGLKVLRSATHSLPVHYVSPGLDAMVASTSDLILSNDSNSTIYIDSHLLGNNINFTLYGEPCGFVVKLRSEVLEILSGKNYVEENMEITDWKENELFRIIKEPKNGLVSASYREFYDYDGTLLFKERLRKTIYLAQKGKIVYKFSTDSRAS